MKRLCVNLVIAGALLLIGSRAAVAQIPATYECNLSGLPSDKISGCRQDPPYDGTPACTKLGDVNCYWPGNNTTYYAEHVNPEGKCESFNAWCGVYADAGEKLKVPLAVSPVDVNNHCRWIDNNSSQTYFVPFKTKAEWDAFRAEWEASRFKTPPNLTLTHCAVPRTASMVASLTTPFSPPGYPGCTPINIDNPTSYGRFYAKDSILNSTWPKNDFNPSITCHNGGTAVQSLIHWMADDAEPGDVRLFGTLSWHMITQYGPDVSLVVKDNSTGGAFTSQITNVTPGDSLTLKWTFQGAVKCTPNGDNPGEGWDTKYIQVIPGILNQGTFDLISLGGANYSLTCWSSTNNLSSTAIAVAADLGKCGPADKKVLAAQPPDNNLCGVDNVVSTPLSATSTGWKWNCSPANGTNNTSQQCSASLIPPQCGPDVTVDPNTGATTGTLCVSGQASAVSSSDGAYTCTTGPGTPSLTQSCLATVKSACIPTGQPVPPGQTQCPSSGCFFQVSGGLIQGAFSATRNDDGYVDDALTPMSIDGTPLGEIVGAGNYPITSPFQGYGGLGDFMSAYVNNYDSSQYPFLFADGETFDSIAIGSSTHVIIFKGRNFTGGTWLDIRGPAVIENMIWFPTEGCAVQSGGDKCVSERDYNAIFNSAWPSAPSLTPSVRTISDSNMQEWGRGSSVQVFCNGQ